MSYSVSPIVTLVQSQKKKAPLVYRVLHKNMQFELLKVLFVKLLVEHPIQ